MIPKTCEKKMMAVEMSLSLPCLRSADSSFCSMEPDLIRLQRHALPLNPNTSRSLDLSLIGIVLASCQGHMGKTVEEAGDGLAVLSRREVHVDINNTGKTSGQPGDHSTSWTRDWPPMIPPGPKPKLKTRHCYRYSVRSPSGPSVSSATGNSNICEPCENINALFERAVSQKAKDENYHSRDDYQEGVMESKERGEYVNSPPHEEEVSTVWVGRNAKIKLDNKKGKKRSTLIGTSKREEEGKEEQDKVVSVTMQTKT